MGWFSAIGSIVGGLISSRGNTRAARIASESSLAAAKAIREGNEAAGARFEEIQEEGAPGVALLRRIVARPAGDLSEGQHIGLADTERAVRNRLATGGLRGAGRAGAAVFNDARRRFIAGAIDRNETASRSAATNLSNRAGAAAAGAAQTDVNSGNAQGRALITAGGVNADAEIANASNISDTVGVLSSIFARDLKSREREQRGTEGRKSV